MSKEKTLSEKRQDTNKATQMKESKKIIKSIKKKEKELNELMSRLDELGMAGRKAVYFNLKLIGWSYDLKIDRLSIRIEGERLKE